MDWVVYPERFHKAAIAFVEKHGGVVDSKRLKLAAEDEAINLVEIYAGTGHGFGSSDFSHSLKAVLEYAGYKTAWVNGLLTLEVQSNG